MTSFSSQSSSITKMQEPRPRPGFLHSNISNAYPNHTAPQTSPKHIPVRTANGVPRTMRTPTGVAT